MGQFYRRRTLDEVLALHSTPGPPDECWLWTGPKGGKTESAMYGRAEVSGVLWFAHRLAWVVANGAEIPDGFVVRHKCDVRLCVNPSHLELGTQLDNIADRQSRGRQAVGSKIWTAKLTAEDIDTIHRMSADGHTQREIGLAIGVAHVTVGNVLRGRFWKHYRSSALPDATSEADHHVITQRQRPSQSLSPGHDCTDDKA